MRRDPDIDERLWRYASWAVGGGQIRSQGVSSIYGLAEKVSGSDWDRTVSWSSRIQFDNLECAETNLAVASLRPDLRRVLKRVYITAPGHLQDSHCRALRISRTTLWRRLCEIDVKISKWLRDRRIPTRAVDFLKRQAYKRGMLAIRATA